MYQRIIRQTLGCNALMAALVEGVIRQEAPNHNLDALSRVELEDAIVTAYRVVEYGYNVVIGEA